jgi:hypothetical protein
MTNLASPARRAVFVAILALVCGIPAPARSAADDLVAIKARLDETRTSRGARSVSGSYGTVGLLVFSVRDTRSFDAPARRKIVSVALSGFGDVVGYVLKKNGTPVCSFYGITDGVCLSLAGCVSGTVCD